GGGAARSANRRRGWRRCARRPADTEGPSPLYRPAQPERKATMSLRKINVVHLLVPRRIKGALQLFFSPHPRWHQPDSGRSLLALPAKKFATLDSNTGQPRSLDDALAGIVRYDLHLADAPRPPLLL